MAMEPLPLGYGDAMDAALFSSLWTFQDQVVQPQETVEELKQSLLTATVELEASKEELRRRDQTIAKLADLVRQVAKERDEALDRAQQLALLVKQQAAAAAQAALVTSSVTDSDCSLVSSPVDPFFDPVTSSDRRRCGKLSPPPPPAKQQQQQKSDADVVLDMLAGKRPLPPWGQFLQSAMEAGPLLQNLLVAGPLPRCRNPPPVHALDAVPVGAAPVCGGFPQAPVPSPDPAIQPDPLASRNPKSARSRPPTDGAAAAHALSASRGSTDDAASGDGDPFRTPTSKHRLHFPSATPRSNNHHGAATQILPNPSVSSSPTPPLRTAILQVIGESTLPLWTRVG